MELQHINVKIFVDGELTVDPARFIEVFHRWIREKVLDGILIDVADYMHVPAGPGVMLIAHDAQYSMDMADDRCGLLYNHKSRLDGSNRDRLRQALAFAARACVLLEKEFADEGPLKFSRNEFEIMVNDRALAPNTPQTFEECKPELEQFLREALGDSGATLVHHDDARSRFRVGVKTSKPFDIATVSGK